MTQDEPRYAVKFMARVDEERAEEAANVLRESVTPILREWGFREVLTISRGLKVVESRVLRRLLEDAPAESGYARRIRDLHETLVMGGPKSYAHSMLYHRDKQRYAEEHGLIREALESEDNWVTLPIRQFDCFALYDTEVDMKADALGRSSMAEGRQHSGDLAAGELSDLLISPLRGTRHTVLHRSPRSHEALYSAYAAQTQVSVFPHRKEARAWIRERLLPALAVQSGYLGALALRSLNMGFVAGRGTVPRGLAEHRGEGRKRPGKTAGSPCVPCECLTLWETEADLSAGVAMLVESLPGTLGGNLASAFIEGEGFVHTERGELLL